MKKPQAFDLLRVYVNVWLCLVIGMVEMAGVEPASASTTSMNLHA